MRILFCGGGTAGHISPSLALAEKLSQEPKNDFAFVGRNNGKENGIILKRGYKLYTLPISGLSRKSPLSFMKGLINILKSTRLAKRIVLEFKPDLVMGMGGYVSFPTLIAARRLNIKTAIHESNSTPGLVTRLLADKCEKVFLGSQLVNDEKGILKRTNTIITGNPTLTAFGSLSKSDATKKLKLPKDAFIILSVGGSGGAKAVNDEIISFMKEYSVKHNRVCHIHSTGVKYFDYYKQTVPDFCNSKGKCRILPFINDMPTYLSAADVVITRCGAMTLSEIAVSGVIPIMIPSPNVTDDHQLNNAKIYADANAGILIEENQLTVSRIINEIEKLRGDTILRNAMKSNIRNLARPEASELIINELLSLTS